jgi:hypothetical protein
MHFYMHSNLHKKILFLQKVGVTMFDGILYHFPCSLVEDNVGHLYSNTFCQIKMFLRVREN